MTYLKQLIFGLIYLCLLGWVIYLGRDIVENPWIIFDLGWGSLWELVMFDLYVGLCGLLFALGVVMSKEKLIDIGVAVIGGILPVAILGMGGIIWGGIILIGEILALVMIRKNLNSYLTFNAGNILMPGIKTLTTVALLGCGVIYGINLQNEVNTNGFQLPEGIVDSAIKLSGGDQDSSSSITDSLSQNSGLLAQFGVSQEQLSAIDPKMVEQFLGGSKQVNQQSIIKEAVNKQVSSVITPALPYMGLIMAGLFVISMLGIMGLLYPLIGLAVWGAFKIMEKIGVIRFEKEMREVQKLVV